MKRTQMYLGMVSMLAVVGCSSTDRVSDSAGSAANGQSMLTSASGSSSVDRAKISELQQELERTQNQLDMVKRGQNSSPAAADLQNVSAGLLPPDAESGMCYARVWVPPTYGSYSEKIMVSDASESVEIIPAQYEWVDETVLVQQASTRIEEIPAVFGTESETIQVQAAQLLWRTDLEPKAAPASQDLMAAAAAHGIDTDAAKPGMCFHEHYRAEQYETVSRQVEISPASYRFETAAAQYEWEEEQVLIREAGTELREIPAEYRNETKTVVDVPAHTLWKKGRGPIQRIDDATGEIMCLVDVPATYKTISQKKLVSAARTETVEIPAEYKTIRVKKLVSEAQEKRIDVPAQFSSVDVTNKLADADFVWHPVHDRSEPGHTRTGAKICLTETPAKFRTVERQVVLTPASTRTVEIAAEYETVQVRKLVGEARELRSEIPARYETVTLQTVNQDGHMEWRSILCETNTNTDLVRRLQAALSEKGYSPGSIDGHIGNNTISAVNSYQRDNDLPVDEFLNIDTLKHLDVL